MGGKGCNTYSPRPPLGPPLSSSIGLALLLLLLALLFWLYIVMSNWTGGALLVLYSFALMLIIIILIIFIFRRDLLCPLGGLGLLLPQHCSLPLVIAALPFHFLLRFTTAFPQLAPRGLAFLTQTHAFYFLF